MAPRIAHCRIASSCLVALLLIPKASSGDVAFYSNVAAFSKWDNPQHGTPAVVTWSFVTDGTGIAATHPDFSQFSGVSKIGVMRAAFDGTYGAGAFDTAVQNAFNTWAAAADITFLGPLTDSGLPVGHTGPPVTDIRISAFEPMPGTVFASAGAFGYGPPGDDVGFPNDYPVAGDILFNVVQPFVLKSGAEGDPVDPFGNDLEGLTLHELAHAAIGLDHPAQGPGDVTYIGPGCCDFINRQLSQDDLAGVRWIYGPSDFNGDSVVNAADYTVWRDRKTEALATIDPGDVGYRDFVASKYDQQYDYWRADFGVELSHNRAIGLTVPEPNTLVIVLTLLAYHKFRRFLPR